MEETHKTLQTAHHHIGDQALKYALYTWREDVHMAEKEENVTVSTPSSAYPTLNMAETVYQDVTEHAADFTTPAYAESP